jgi:hypothetical protein
VTAPDDDGSIQLPLIWPDVNDVSVLMSNVHLLQISEPDCAVLTLGQAAPPVVLGTPEEQQTMVRAIGGVSVRAICRVSMTRVRVAELAAGLNQLLANMNSAAAQHENHGNETEDR